MRLLNWRRQAALNAMPGIRPGEIHTPWHEFWRRFRRQPVAMGAGIFVLLLIAVAIVAPWIAPYDAENYFDYDRLNEGPSLVHWFGVDSLGRDIFSRVLVGAQISLAAGVLAVLIGAAIGTVLGLLAGYYEGWWDRLIMRLCDVLFAFPGILLAIAVVAVMGSGMANVIIAVAIFSIPAFARLVRGNTLVLKQQTFIESARSIGASHHSVQPYSAGDGVIDRGLFHHAHWGIDYFGGQSVVSRPRRAAAHPGVGRDAQRSAGGYGDVSARGALSGGGDFRDRAGV